MQFRRSLYVVQNLQPGDKLGPENVRAIRPGFGLSPKHYGEVMGRHVSIGVARGTPLSWSILK